MISVSLAVVYHNEEKNLPRLLQSIADEFVADETLRLDLLLIDNASKDQSRSVAEEFIKNNPQIKARSLARDKNHMAEARQQSLTESDSQWVIYVDADSKLESGWFKGLKRSIQNTTYETVVIGGASSYKGTEYWHSFVLPLANYFPLGRTQSHATDIGHVPTNNYLVHRQRALEVGGFDPFFKYVGEDLDINVRLRRNYKITYDPSFRVEHYLPCSEYDWYQKMAYYGRAQSFVFFKYWRGISPLKLLPMLICILTVLLAVMKPWVTGIVFTVLFLSPRSRFYMFSFLFYGLGELVGSCMAIYFQLKGDLRERGPSLEVTPSPTDALPS